MKGILTSMDRSGINKPFLDLIGVENGVIAPSSSTRPLHDFVAPYPRSRVYFLTYYCCAWSCGCFWPMEC